MTDPLDQLMQRIRGHGFGCLLRDEPGKADDVVWFAGIYARCWGAGADCLAEGRGETPLLAMQLAEQQLRQAGHKRAKPSPGEQEQLRLV